MERILILGTGAWATALANILIENKHFVDMYGIDEKEIKDLNNQCNTKYFGYKKLVNKPSHVCSDLKKLLSYNPTYILIAIPSIFIDDVLNQLIQLTNDKYIFINVAKGLSNKSNVSLSTMIKSTVKNNSNGLVTLIGPSFANEVFENEPTIVNAISSQKALAAKVANLFNNNHFKCVEITDELGAELCAALKNVMAIACGITYQLHTSINTRSAILAQVTKEIYYIIKKQGGEIDTLLQFCGIGDIFLTCSDDKSRNFSFGKMVAIKGARKALERNTKTVEGYKTLEVAHNLVDKYKLDTPVIKALYDVVYKNKDPKTFVNDIIKKIII